MARARNIKPGLFKNEDLAECSIWARFIFPGLWMLADREGRLEDRPKRIKGELLPFDAQDVEPLLRELHDRGFILRYDAGGLRAIQILKFREHQAPHYSEKPSVIKAHEFPELQPNLGDDVSGKKGVIKTGSQPPDSLIPSSLNPESLKKQSEKKPAVIPPWLLPDLWQRWCDFRKAKSGKAWTVDAQALSLRTLSKLRDTGHDPAVVIDQSIEAGWTGLFEPKSTKGGPGGDRWWLDDAGAERKGREVGVTARPGESRDQFVGRIREAIRNAA